MRTEATISYHILRWVHLEIPSPNMRYGQIAPPPNDFRFLKARLVLAHYGKSFLSSYSILGRDSSLVIQGHVKREGVHRHDAFSFQRSL